MAPKDFPLQSGIEIELAIHWKGFNPGNFKDYELNHEVRKELKRLLQDQISKIEVLDINERRPKNPGLYKTHWILSNEDGLIPAAIYSDHSQCKHGIEFASPIAVTDDLKWMDDIHVIFTMLEEQRISIINLQTCATHVHVSPVNGPWKSNLEALKRVSKAIVYYERCTDGLVRRDRLDKDVCKESNSQSVFYQQVKTMDPKEIKKILSAIDGCKDVKQLTGLMCTKREGSKDVKEIERDVILRDTEGSDQPFENTVRRSFRWSFLPLTEKDERGSIEFRQAEGSATAEIAIEWRLFVTGFVQSAVTRDIDPNIEPNMDMLKEFATSGTLTNFGGKNQAAKAIAMPNIFGVTHSPSKVEHFELSNKRHHKITRNDFAPREEILRQIYCLGYQ